jgi:hypothetical protein
MIGDANAVGGIGTVLAQLKSLPVPDGWLSCDGKCYDGMNFPTLFGLLKHKKFQAIRQVSSARSDGRPFLPEGC